MKTPILFALALLLSALGSGCASISTEQLQAEAARVGYGAPLPSDWHGIVKDFMEVRLKDSSTAIYRFGNTWPGYVTKPLVAGGGFRNCGYWVEVMINAKNSYGGYVGFSEYKFLIRDGVVVAHAQRDNGFWVVY